MPSFAKTVAVTFFTIVSIGSFAGLAGPSIVAADSTVGAGGLAGAVVLTGIGIDADDAVGTPRLIAVCGHALRQGASSHCMQRVGRKERRTLGNLPSSR